MSGRVHPLAVALAAMVEQVDRELTRLDERGRRNLDRLRTLRTSTGRGAHAHSHHDGDADE